MKIVIGSERFRLRNDHPYAQAIVALARAYQQGTDVALPLPERNDVKQLWRELSDGHRQFLREIAVRPRGVTQSELEASLELDWKGLRGVHNGLTRISERLGCERLVRAIGYNSLNRKYLMDPDVAATVRRVYKAQRQ